MKDDFDKRLKDRITGVFDNFEDASADAGWALLREKYPEKKKRRGIVWLWVGSAAAVILLLLGIGIWGDHQHSKQSKALVKVSRSEKTSTDTTLSSGKTKNITSTSQNTISAATLTSPGDKSVQSNGLSVVHKNIAINKPVKRVQTVVTNQQNVISQPNTITNNSAKIETAKNSEQKSAETTTVATAQPAADTSVKKNIAQNDAKPIKPMVRSPFTDNDPVIKKDKPNKSGSNSKLVSFGVYAATYVNYASGSSSPVNLGAGLASDIHLSKNLKLSTGIAVNQNTLDYGNHLPSHGGLFGSVNAAVNLASFTAASSAASYSIPVLKSYYAQLTSLDVPLNLKYEFNPQKSSSFISFGVSSGTFINESYISQYGSATTITQTLKNNPAGFSSFYFAKTLDFSFGLGYPIGKNHLSIEPFVKYPLRGMGAEQILFGAGGLNLKFNFSDNKK